MRLTHFHCELSSPDRQIRRSFNFLKTSNNGVSGQAKRKLLRRVRDHAFFETHKTDYTVWKKERMGEKAFNFLMVRAHIAGKRDDKLRIMLLKIVEGTEFRKARPMKEPECKSCDEVIQPFDRTLKLLDKTLIKAKRLLHDHPDSVILTEAYERLSGQG